MTSRIARVVAVVIASVALIASGVLPAAASTPSGSLVGTITDVSGAPLTGVLVEAWSDYSEGSPPTAQAVTSSSGGFAIPGLQPGAYWVEIVDPAGVVAPTFVARDGTAGVATVTDARVVVVGDQAPTPLSQSVQRGATIHGVIGSAPVPLDQIIVTPLYQDASDSDRKFCATAPWAGGVPVGADGSWTARDLFPGRYEIAYGTASGECSLAWLYGVTEATGPTVVSVTPGGDARADGSVAAEYSVSIGLSYQSGSLDECSTGLIVRQTWRPDAGHPWVNVRDYYVGPLPRVGSSVYVPDLYPGQYVFGLWCASPGGTVYGTSATTDVSGPDAAVIHTSMTVHSGSMAVDAQPVYRFWSPVYHGHFFTIDPAERDHIISTWPSIWQYEGPRYDAFTTQQPGTVPLYRFWSARYNGHFYTTSVSERDHVEAVYDDYTWRYEKVAYWVYPTDTTASDTVPVARFWSAAYGHHFYTADPSEAAVVKTYPTAIWNYENDSFRVPAVGLPLSATTTIDCTTGLPTIHAVISNPNTYGTELGIRVVRPNGAVALSGTVAAIPASSAGFTYTGPTFVDGFVGTIVLSADGVDFSSGPLMATCPAG